MDLPWEDKYAKVLREMAKKKDIKELAQISPEQVEILSDMTFGATGTLKDAGKVTSLLSKEVEALREAIANKNKFAKADEPVGKLIQAEGGTLKDIKIGQQDRILAENKKGFAEASNIYNSIRNELKAIEDAKGSLSPEEIASYQARMDEYFNHPYSDKDEYARMFLKSSITEPLRRLDPRNYQKKPEPLADVIEIMRSKK